MAEDRAVEIKGGIRSTTEEYSADKRARRIKGDSGYEIRTNHWELN